MCFIAALMDLRFQGDFVFFGFSFGSLLIHLGHVVVPQKDIVRPGFPLKCAQMQPIRILRMFFFFLLVFNASKKEKKKKEEESRLASS